jgi:hypothetical protein
VALLGAMVVGLLVMRNDFWQWDEPGYLLLGALPVGLWWQGLVTVLASVVMALMVRLAWPAKLEADAMAAEERRHGGAGSVDPSGDGQNVRR